MTDEAKTLIIRGLNDRLRQCGEGGSVMITAGLGSYGAQLVYQAFDAVRAFDAFSEDNDPWGEHDCAVLTVGPHSVIFKIDYHDPFYVGGSDDASDPTKTRRVLTIMLAGEY